MKAKFSVEVLIDGNWVPYKLLTRSRTFRHALNRLPRLIKDFSDHLDCARIKRLHNDKEIADAKISVSNIWGTKHLET
jgi:hypothetical protein